MKLDDIGLSPVHTRQFCCVRLSLARQDRLESSSLNLLHKTCELKVNKI